MKKITLPLFLLTSFFSYGQITIQSTDVPIPTDDYPTLSITPTSTATIGTNKIWDFGSFVGSNPGVLNYAIEIDPFFTSQGIDVFSNTTKAFNADFSYDIAYEYDFNTNAVDDKGMYVYKQAYELSTFTGSNLDSLVMAEQKYILPIARTYMKFPMTMGTAWNTISARSVDFKLTVAAASLSNTPVQHRFNIVRSDSIVGWGKLSVHTGSGASVQYDVLVDKLAQYAVDSFYLAGSPAPTSLLAAFGVTQGQMTDKQYAYHFYRKGATNYLMRLWYSDDNTYTNLAGAFIAGDGLTTVGIGEKDQVNYASVLFPNPTNRDEINIQILGKQFLNTTFTISDITGKLVSTGTTLTRNGESLVVILDPSISNGQYFVKINDLDGNMIVNEKVQINR
jgi:hypothetical protein